MLTLQPLPAPRQRNVGHAVAEMLKQKNKVAPEVTRRGKAVVEATAALKDPEGPTMFVIDVATDGVLTALHRIVNDIDRGLVDTVVPLGPEQQAYKDAAELLNDTWFEQGVDFVRDSVGIQNDVMATMRRALNHPTKGPKLRAAIATLGLGPMVDHLLKHMDLYAKKLGLTGASEEEPTMSAASKAWHQAYTLFAASVLSAYGDDPEMQGALLGSYQKQLEEHREDAAKARKRAKKAQAEAQKKAQAEAAQGEAQAKAEAKAAPEDQDG